MAKDDTLTPHKAGCDLTADQRATRSVEKGNLLRICGECWSKMTAKAWKHDAKWGEVKRGEK